jgi:hypothetical protein
MVPAVRWLLVAAVAAGLASAPTLVRALPAEDSDVGAAALATSIREAHDLAWSGEVRSQGSLEVPVTGSVLGGVPRLLGERSDLRVWWRGPEDWRVDRLRSTGESDLLRDGGLVVRWNYEANKAGFAPYSPIRLPDDADLVPVELAHRMLAGAQASELSRLPARRIVGHSAAGLRLVPADERSTIARVDIWADTATGLPLRVDVYGDTQRRRPVLSSEVTAVTMHRPSKEETNFHLSPSIDFSRGVALDDAAGANAFAPFLPPEEVAALPRLGNADDFGAVGVYGRGPTAILAVPLRDFVAGGLRSQLRKSPASTDYGTSIALEIGPLSVLLADVAGGHFLVAGTVTPATLRLAARDLEKGVRRTTR